MQRNVYTINNSTQLLPFTQLEMLPYASDSLNTFPVGAEREAAAAALIETMVADADARGAPLIGWVLSPVPNMDCLCLTRRPCLCVMSCGVVWCVLHGLILAGTESWVRGNLC